MTGGWVVVPSVAVRIAQAEFDAIKVISWLRHVKGIQYLPTTNSCSMTFIHSRTFLRLIGYAKTGTNKIFGPYEANVIEG